MLASMREQPFNTSKGFGKFGGWTKGWISFQTLKPRGGDEILFMPHKQTYLINLIKGLFLWKNTIEFGYIKKEFMQIKFYRLSHLPDQY